MLLPIIIFFAENIFETARYLFRLSALFIHLEMLEAVKPCACKLNHLFYRIFSNLVYFNLYTHQSTSYSFDQYLCTMSTSAILSQFCSRYE